MAKDLFKKSLTQEQFSILTEIVKDPYLFATFCMIVHPLKGAIRFNLYSFQKKVLYYFLRYRFNIILKFRQAGLTELIAMYALWLTMFHPYKNVQIISIKDKVAKKVLSRIKFTYKHLPDWLRMPIINGRPADFGTMCISKDTVIVGSDSNFKIGDIIPKKPGVIDVSNLNIRVLTHRGKFQKVKYAINKGKLKTLKIVDDRGNILKCTPKHRLLTPEGWKHVEDILKFNLPIIQWDSTYSNNIWVSRIKLIKEFNSTICDIEVENDNSYITESNFVNHNTEMVFANGSSITSVPTTEDAGRSEAVSLLVIDEAAIVRYANQIWAAAFPTLSTGGSAIVNSTPYGVGNWYHKSWVDSLTPNSTFHPIRLKWQMHPDRDIKWYNEMAAALGPRRTAQEVDGSFLASGFSVFDLADIKQIEDLMSDFEVIETRYNGGLRVIKKPSPSKKYFIGADIATGRAKDYSAFSIMDRQGDEVAYFKGRVPIEKFIEILNEYGRLYNNALLAPEANDVGIAVVIGLQNLNYPNLYYTETLVKEKGKSRKIKKKTPGWMTTSQNRTVIIDELEQDIRNEWVDVKDPFFAEEAYTFIYDSRNRPVAMGKGNLKEGDDDDITYTDDSIMAKAITNFIRKGSMNSMIVLPA